MILHLLRVFLCIFGFCAAFLPLQATAQSMPMHFDPGARDQTPDLSLLPTLRFLTSTGFPPFNYRNEDGELVGYHLDLARAICTKLEARCSIQAWPYDQTKQALIDGQGDALLAGLAVTEQNAQDLDYSFVYLKFPGRFVVTRDKDNPRSPSLFEIAAPGDNQKVGVVKGSAHEVFLNRYFDRIDLIEFDTDSDGLEALKNEEVQAFFGDGMRLSFWLNENECCLFSGAPYFDAGFFGEGLSIAVQKDQENLRHAMNWALARLQDDKVLEQIYLSWFPINFYQAAR